VRLQDLAEQFGLELRGNPDHRIEGVGTLKSATAEQISFLANPAYTRQLETTKAGAVVIRASEADRYSGNALVADDPYLAYARIATLFAPKPAVEPGIHASAVIDADALIGENVSIGPHVVIGSESRIGDGSTIMAGTVIGPDCMIGDGCLLYPNVTLAHGVTLGNRVILHPGAVIGADGFGIAFAADPETGGRWEKVPQLGGVRIGDDCEIGANSCVDRGAIEDTILEADVRIDNHVQVGHNVTIGSHTAIAGSSGIAGSASIGRYCLIAGKVGINGHVTIADKTTVAAGTNVMKSIDEPGLTWSTNIPAQPFGNWQRNLVHLLKLGSLHKRIRKLEKNSPSETGGESDNNE
jgi:UDP-3-O-[3-hydroxymyristoyl] glucosamine N-acyltransferase